ncbi:MAG: biotin synthase BioB [Verrucomicrobia bacterium]|nr:biotin synthase BioB [Verrucomicrobiota bacterium]
MKIRSDWTKEEIREIHDSPLLELIYRAATVSREYHTADRVQVCSLISIKTGGCPEDCKYCPQSARYRTNVEAAPLMSEEEIVDQAKAAIASGATRVCLGAAWRSVRDSSQFDLILRAVRKIADLGVEVCCTLGMVSESQALRLKEAGLTAYNHNLDTSPEFYPSIVTTRRYEDRLQTLDTVEKAGIGVCCGGIIGMGESLDDRISLLHQLATRNPHPGSVPINLLIPIQGTPLEMRKKVPIWEMVRMVATARITMPKAMVRLSAGRLGRSLEEQALYFLAGANSIHSGKKLLTRPNPDYSEDEEMFRLLGLRAL